MTAAVGPEDAKPSKDASKEVETKPEVETEDSAGESRDSAGENDSSSSWLPTTRRVIAAILTLASVVVTIASYWWQPLTICRSVNGGSNFVAASNCNPWTPQDLLPVLVVVALLLAPDFTELNIFNVISMKREIKAAKAEGDALRARQEALEFQLSTQINQVSSQQVENHNHFYPSEPASKLPEAIREKLHDDQASGPPAVPVVEGGERSPGRQVKRGRGDGSQGSFRVVLSSADVTKENADDAPYEAVALALIDEWEALSRFMGPRSTKAGSDSEIKKRRRFELLFKDELDIVRSVRNNIAHGKRVSREDLVGAYKAALELERIANGA